MANAVETLRNEDKITDHLYENFESCYSQYPDLNKVGVCIGNDLEIDANGHLYANPDHFYNENGKFNDDEVIDPKNKFEFTLFVLNIYYIILTRGIDGIRFGFWKHDLSKVHRRHIGY